MQIEDSKLGEKFFKIQHAQFKSEETRTTIKASHNHNKFS